MTHRTHPAAVRRREAPEVPALLYPRFRKCRSRKWKFARAVRAAELHDCTFHDTRRTYASRLVNRGVSLPIIAKLLGHGATYVTERYAHVSEGALAAAVARLDVSRFPADGAPVTTRSEQAAVTPQC